MPLPSDSPASSNGLPASSAPQCSKSALRVVVFALVLGAILIVVLPLKIPLALRALIAGSDLLAAAVIALYVRQNRQR